MFELSKQFRFEAAHTLERTIDAEGSRRIHGHSYRAEVVIRGKADPETGMVVDLGLFERALEPPGSVSTITFSTMCPGSARRRWKTSQYGSGARWREHAVPSRA